MPKGERSRDAVELTKRGIDALKVDPLADYFVWDARQRGLGVRVRRTGRVTFVLLYRVKGAGRRTRLLTLGTYGQITLDMARRLAKKHWGEIADAKDPVAVRREANRAVTVKAFGDEFLAAIEGKRKATTAAEYRRILTRYVVPALGALQVRAVSSADVSRLHRSLRAAPYMANRVLAFLGAFFSLAEQLHHRAPHANPVRGIEPFPEESRERFLTAEEFGRLGVAMRTAERTGLPPAPRHRRRPRSEATAKHRPHIADIPRPAAPAAVNALRLLALSGLREQEALRLRWGQIDFARGVLRFTRSQSKTGAKDVPLGASAAVLLDALWDGRRDAEGHPLVPVGSARPVFPGATPGEPLREIRRLWYAVRHAAGLEDVRLHDLRHSVGSLLGQGGESLLVIRDVLGHRRAATTEKYAHLGDSPARRAADRVSGEIAGLLAGPPAGTTPTPVIPLRKAR